jgi:hypothetical protein
MKALPFLALFALPLNSALAEDCKQDALQIAKMNLDQVAKKYGFDSSDIGEAHARNSKSDKLSIYQVDGAIYKAQYTVTIRFDSSCALQSLQISEDQVSTLR